MRFEIEKVKVPIGSREGDMEYFLTIFTEDIISDSRSELKFKLVEKDFLKLKKKMELIK